VLFSLGDDDDSVNDNGFFLQAWERVTTQWRVVGGSSLHILWRYLLTKNCVYILDRVIISSGIVFLSLSFITTYYHEQSATFAMV